jgi:uncharacterized protein YukE
MLKMMSDMSDRMVGKMTNMVGEVNGKVGEITNIVGKMNGRMGEMSQTVNSHSQSIAKLEAQVRQVVNTLNTREEGKLPSQSVVNPKGLYMVEGSTFHLEQVQVITTLRSGRVVDNLVEEKKKKQLGAPQTMHQDRGKQVSVEASTPYAPTSEILYEPKVPFPELLKAPSHFGKQGEKIQNMMETFKQVKVNIPLLDAIKQISAYAKFLKDLCTQKRKNRKHIPKKVILIEQVSTLIQHNTFPKFKYLGTPTISCVIRNTEIERALLD